MLQDGVLSQELRAFLVAAQPHGVSRRNLEAFLADTSWLFPGSDRKSQGLHRIFSQQRVSSEAPDKVKGTSSELLGVYGLIQRFVDVHLADKARTCLICMSVCMSR